MANTAKKTNVAFENDTHSINVQPLAADNGAEGFTLTVMLGKATKEDGTNAGVRYRVFRKDVPLSDAAIAQPKAVVLMGISTMTIEGATSKEEKAAFYDVDKAVTDLKALTAEPKKEAETPWDKLSNAETLTQERAKAAESATEYEASGNKTRAAMYEMAQHVANAAKEMTAKQTQAWVESGPAILKKYIGAKNALTEFVKVGRLPADYLAELPEGALSPKAIDLYLRTHINELAEAIAEAAWKTKAGKPRKNAPNAGEVSETLRDILNDAQGPEVTDENPEPEWTAPQILAQVMCASLEHDTSEFSVVYLVNNDEGAIVPAKTQSGDYVAGTMFGTGNRVNELVGAVVKALPRHAPEAIAEAEQAAEEKETVEALKPKTFSDFTIRNAALHLAKVLHSHEEHDEVAEMLHGMSMRVKNGAAWTDVLADTAEQVTEEAAQAATEEAVENADDAA